jgi:hypothetical protein
LAPTNGKFSLALSTMKSWIFYIFIIVFAIEGPAAPPEVSDLEADTKSPKHSAEVSILLNKNPTETCLL